jgi:S-adenosylmethionine:tRNA ribosyltransferase-isomerase
MKTDNFNYPFDPSLIAKYPVERRDESNLMVVHSKTKKIEEKKFKNIIDYFRKGDVIVFNITKVIPARIIGGKKMTGGKFEILISKILDDITAEVMINPGRKAKIGDRIIVGEYEIEIIKRDNEGLRIIKLLNMPEIYSMIRSYGKTPIPPYLKRESEDIDKERYQSVFAKIKGSCAAPTASLHFTNSLINELESKGIIITNILLHVGIGTFRPVKTKLIEEHNMHMEYYKVFKETANIVNKAKEDGRRIFAIGTTTVRALESAVVNNKLIEGEGETDIFIYPPYDFKLIDNLITNFHFPKSTLLMLVCAFGGTELILSSYKKAVENRYRFFSYGDAMMVINHE